jgi:hypothetical protein
MEMYVPLSPRSPNPFSAVLATNWNYKNFSLYPLFRSRIQENISIFTNPYYDRRFTIKNSYIYYYIMVRLIQARVGRPSKDLYEFREEILNLFQAGETAEQIANHLQDNYDYAINGRTIRRRLNEWGIITRRVRTIDLENIDNQIMSLFFQCGLSDDEIHYVLRKQDYTIGSRALRDRRRLLCLYRRLSGNGFEAVEANIREAVQKELDKGYIEGSGQKHLYMYFRSNQHIVSRYAILGLYYYILNLILS